MAESVRLMWQADLDEALRRLDRGEKLDDRLWAAYVAQQCGIATTTGGYLPRGGENFASYQPVRAIAHRESRWFIASEGLMPEWIMLLQSEDDRVIALKAAGAYYEGCERLPDVRAGLRLVDVNALASNF